MAGYRIVHDTQTKKDKKVYHTPEEQTSFEERTANWEAGQSARDLIGLREERDKRLVVSDSAVLPDRWETMSQADKNKWSLYRQSLRDLPATALTQDVQSMVYDKNHDSWPKKPS